MNTIESKNETNYRKWSFKFLIYLIIINIAVFYIVVNFTNDSEKFNSNLNIISIIGNLILLIGIILLGLSIIKKEKKNYQFYISIFGYSFFLIRTILSLF